MTTYPLKVLPELLAIVRLPADADVPAWALSGSFASVTRTVAELSVVAPAAAVPSKANAERAPDGVVATGGWRALQVDATLDFALTGVLATLAAPLAEAGVSIFALSTYDTDYLLVPAEQLDRALAALRAAGHTVA